MSLLRPEKQRLANIKRNRYTPAMIGFQPSKWRITIFKRDQLPDGRVCEVELETFEGVQPVMHATDVVDPRGRLLFQTAEGKRVSIGGLPYVAKEL